MELRIVRADPAGNITIFVLDRLDDPALRLRAAKALLAQPSLKAEQVGFVIPPDPTPLPVTTPLPKAALLPRGSPSEDLPLAGTTEDRRPARPWRLEMMGDEFCGNAARSFGLYVAREAGLRGKQDIHIGISGAPDPVAVHVDIDSSTAEAEIPGPRAETLLFREGRSLPLYFFDGIAHLIAGGLSPSRDMAIDILESVRQQAGDLPAALGVMFYDPIRRFMQPVVYVAATESLVFESSCGSGTAALAVYLSRALAGGEDRWEIFQPGGVIEARVKKQAGKIATIGIGGPVSLGGSTVIRL
jgi:diaminopimelate epimerase